MAYTLRHTSLIKVESDRRKQQDVMEATASVLGSRLHRKEEAYQLPINVIAEDGSSDDKLQKSVCERSELWDNLKAMDTQIDSKKQLFCDVCSCYITRGNIFMVDSVLY